MYVMLDEQGNLELYREPMDNRTPVTFDYIIEGHEISLGKCSIEYTGSPDVYRIVCSPHKCQGVRWDYRHHVSVTAVSKTRILRVEYLPGHEFDFNEHLRQVYVPAPIDDSHLHDSRGPISGFTVSSRPLDVVTSKIKLYPCNPDEIFISNQSGTIDYFAPVNIDIQEINLEDWTMTIAKCGNSIYLASHRITQLKLNTYYRIRRRLQPVCYKNDMASASYRYTADILASRSQVEKVLCTHRFLGIADSGNGFFRITIAASEDDDGKLYEAYTFPNSTTAYLKEIERPKSQPQLQRMIQLD